MKAVWTFLLVPMLAATSPPVVPPAITNLVEQPASTSTTNFPPTVPHAIALPPAAAQASPAPDQPDQRLYAAAAAGRLVDVKALLGQGANINVAVGMHRFTVIMGAAAAKHWDIVRYLMSRGADLNLGAISGTRPLIFVLENNQFDLALDMVNAGANPNLCDPNFLLPIVYVARSDDVTLMKAFIAHHADVNLNGVDGPAIWHALGFNRPEMVELLLAAGARTDIPSCTAPFHPGHPPITLLAEAVLEKKADMVDLLIDHGAAVNGRDLDGHTPLMDAVRIDSPSMVAQLLEAGANPDLQSSSGETALILSTRYGDGLCTLKVVGHGADLELKDKDGCTALMWAAQHGLLSSAETLVQVGANINATDGHGETPLSYASDKEQASMMDYLTQHGATPVSPHIIARARPDPPLSRAQSWALAVGAIYAQVNGENPHRLGDQDGASAAMRRKLKESWGATDKPTFMRTMQDLQAHGWGSAYRLEGGRLARMSEPQWQSYRTATPLSKEEPAIRALYQKWKDRSGMAWDACRYVNLVNWGFEAEYLTADEAWDLLLPAARELQPHFSSWREMSDNFLDGRAVWNNGPSPQYAACTQLLLNPNEPESVWNEIPWKTDLGPATPAPTK